MAFEKCKDAISAAAGRILSPEEDRLIERETASLLRQMRKNEREGIDPTGELERIIDKVRNDSEQQKAIAKRTAALDRAAREKSETYIKEVWADDPAGGLLAIVQGLNVKRFGAKDSAANSSHTTRHAKVSAFVSDLESQELMDSARSGEFDLEVRKAAAAIDAGEDLSSFSDVAVSLANIFKRHQEVLRQERNSAGAWTGRLEGFVASQTHDMFRVAKGGRKRDMKGRSEDAFQKWKDLIVRLYDPDNSFPDSPGDTSKSRDDLLRSLWTQFATGKHLSLKTAPKTGSKANLGKRASHQRKIVFKSPEAEHEYFLEYGIGDTIYDSVVHSLDFGGRDLGISKKLGPNAKGNLDRIADNIERELVSKGDTDNLDKLKKVRNQIDDKVWPVVSGEASVSDNLALASASETLRNVERIADLGGMFVSSFNDINNAASLANFSGKRTAAGYFEETAGFLKEILGGIGKGTSRDVKTLAAENRILLEGIHVPSANAWSGSEIPGSMAKATQLAFKYFGSQWWQNRIRSQSMLASISRYGMHADLPMAKLPEGMREAFNSYGINEADWNAIRLAEKTEFKGSDMLSTKSIESLSDDIIDAHPDFQKVKSKDAKVLANARKRIRARLSDSYGLLVSDIADGSVTAPNAQTKAIATAGVKRGTVAGELIRHALLFRTYTIGYMTRHLGRELFSYHPDRVGTAAALGRMFTDPAQGQIQSMAGLIGGGVFYGMVSNAAGDLLQGKVKRLPETPEDAAKFVLDGFSRSGALGLYGDMVMGQVYEGMTASDYLVGLLGPTARRTEDLVDLTLELTVRGWDDKSSRKLFKAAYNYVPGRNLFYTRWLSDTFIYHNMQEHIDPGYLDRYEEFQEENLRNEFIVAPSEIVG